MFIFLIFILFFSSGWLYRFCRIHRSCKSATERRDKPETEVVLQTLWPGWKRQDWQRWNGDHIQSKLFIFFFL